MVTDLYWSNVSYSESQVCAFRRLVLPTKTIVVKQCSCPYKYKVSKNGLLVHASRYKRTCKTIYILFFTPLTSFPHRIYESLFIFFQFYMVPAEPSSLFWSLGRIREVVVVMLLLQLCHRVYIK